MLAQNRTVRNRSGIVSEIEKDTSSERDLLSAMGILNPIGCWIRAIWIWKAKPPRASASHILAD